MIRTDDFIITDDVLAEDSESLGFGRGYIPRNYSRSPVGSIPGIKKFDIPLIPRNEWSSRIKDLEQSKAMYADLRTVGNKGGHIESLDQNGQGYCWAYSTAGAITCARLRDGQPYVRLSAHAVACKIKNFRDEGGWNPLSVEYAIKHGYPSVQTWAEKSMSRQYDTAATWLEAANYKIVDGWMDLEASVYNRNLSFDQFMTCLLLRIPCPADYNHWRHSVCGCDPLEADSSLPLSDIRRWAVRIWNSWRDSWGAKGMGVLIGSKAVPDGATACKGVLQTAA